MLIELYATMAQAEEITTVKAMELTGLKKTTFYKVVKRNTATNRS